MLLESIGATTAAVLITELLELGIAGKKQIAASNGVRVMSFFSSLKRERIRRRTYKTPKAARQDVFNYIEMFHNSVRKQVRNGMLSPFEFERQQVLKAEDV
jgi:hypothetical protein